MFLCLGYSTKRGLSVGERGYIGYIIISFPQPAPTGTVGEAYLRLPQWGSGMFVPEVCEKHDSEALVDLLHTSQMDFLGGK